MTHKYTSHVWSEADCDTLRREWKAGKTAGQIAAILGWPTRNAVMGKADRLGCEKRQSTARRQATAETIKRNRKLICKPFPIQPIQTTPLPEPPPPTADARFIDLRLLRPGECVFPVTSHNAQKHLFCGLPAEKVYCEKHQEIAWRKEVKCQ